MAVSSSRPDHLLFGQRQLVRDPLGDLQDVITGGWLVPQLSERRDRECRLSDQLRGVKPLGSVAPCAPGLIGLIDPSIEGSTMPKTPSRVIAATLLVGLLTAPASATWSVVAIDRATKEVGVASATCFGGVDLQRRNAVLRVDVGAGVVQAEGDRDGTRRPLILHELINGTSSERIAEIMRTYTEGHEVRQFGFAHTAGSSATLTTLAADFGGGVAARSGDLFYAIQGNILTGEPVLVEAERALVETEGALPERMMAAMLAARSMGGDGRCSCAGAATGCGSPPASFDKAAHVAYLIVSRSGDGDGRRCDGDATGCANGDYYLNLNFAGLGALDPDPVLLMSDEFDAWRRELRGRPDATESEVEISRSGDVYTMTITLADWRGRSVDPAARTVEVEHAPGSAGATDVGPVAEIGDAAYGVELTPNGRSGVDRFRVTVSDDRGAIVLIPLPRIENGACDARVKKTKARNAGGKLSVTVKVKGAARADQEVGVKITSRLHEPVFEVVGTTNKRGKAKASFTLPSDLYDVHIDSLVPPAGGECFDPYRPKQKIVATDIAID